MSEQPQTNDPSSGSPLSEYDVLMTANANYRARFKWLKANTLQIRALLDQNAVRVAHDIEDRTLAPETIARIRAALALYDSDTPQ